MSNPSLGGINNIARHREIDNGGFLAEHERTRRKMFVGKGEGTFRAPSRILAESQFRCNNFLNAIHRVGLENGDYQSG